MRPHVNPEILALLAGGDVTGTDARTVAEHVAECEACSRELAEIRKSVDEFRGWAADGGPGAEEIETLHHAVMVRLPRTQQRWTPRWAAAIAAAAICVSVALWAPWRVEQRQNLQTPTRAERSGQLPLEASVADGVKGRGDTLSHGSVNRAQRAGKTTAAVGMSNRSAIPGSRSVSLRHDADGEPMLEIATANPNVLILWYVDEGSKKDDDDE
jgi:anti-sigma factor RsiW